MIRTTPGVALVSQQTERLAPEREAQPIAVTTVGTTTTTLLTVPADRFFFLDRLHVCPLVASVDVTVHAVPAGGSAGTATKMIDAEAKTVTGVLLENVLLSSGTRLMVSTDDATGANFWGWGYVASGGDVSH